MLNFGIFFLRIACMAIANRFVDSLFYFPPFFSSFFEQSTATFVLVTIGNGNLYASSIIERENPTPYQVFFFVK